MLSPINPLIDQLLSEAASIPADRKGQLQQLANYIRAKDGNPVNLNFICTHNSRRSHLGMIWAAVAASHFGFQNTTTYSGGTEATAFNPRAVAALQRAGFRVKNPGGDNPRYLVYYANDHPPLVCFSKRYDDPVNAVNSFAAVMTCSGADENCPLIPGAELRLPLTYEDPKAADDTPAEAERYDERVAQIGREILYAFSLA